MQLKLSSVQFEKPREHSRGFLFSKLKFFLKINLIVAEVHTYRLC